jgi:hypothetical protein
MISVIEAYNQVSDFAWTSPFGALTRLMVCSKYGSECAACHDDVNWRSNVNRRVAVGFVLALVVSLGLCASILQASDEQITLVVAAGRPLRVALDERVRLRGVGQPVTATLVESIYAYDRAVVPIGAKVHGYVEKLEEVPKKVRVGAMIDGDFTPLRSVTLTFDRLILPDGNEVRLATRMKGSAENVVFQVAKPASGTSRVARARDAAVQKARDALSPFTKPGKMQRLKEMAIAKLPYHPQYLSKGTIYTMELVEPLNFGTAKPREWAPAGTAPPSETVLNARLITRLDSAKTPRGTPIRAVVTQPVFSADERLILPEGTELHGEVTFATHARRFRRNGKLRFLFESVHLPEREPQKLMASLHSSELSQRDNVAIDEEGGARVTNPKTRFIAPVVGLFAVHAALGSDTKYDVGEIGNTTNIAGQNFGGRAFGGFFGMGFLGTVVAQISRPVAGSLAFVGLGQTVYANLIGRGREVVFPADTSIQLQLSAASTK